MKPHFVGLVGDIGGTHARLALVDASGHVRHHRAYQARDFASLDEVIADYMKTTVGRHWPSRAVLAAAGPVVDGEIAFTNLDWQVSECDLLASFGFEAVKLVNDFAAQAMACPLLEADDLRPIGTALRGEPTGPIVVLGAGTGFGVAGLVRGTLRDIPVATEGGHTGFAPSDDVELEIWRRLHARFGRVSVERLLSGPGIHDLYLCLGEMQGAQTPLADEQAVTAAAASDPLSAAALDRFCSIYGAVAGDLALSYGARGGVFVSGGIAPRIADRLASGGFRARFEDKGRLAAYVQAIPTFLIVHPYPALVGAARHLQQMERL